MGFPTLCDRVLSGVLLQAGRGGRSGAFAPIAQHSCCSIPLFKPQALPAGRVRGLKGHRWFVVACETKLVLYDMVSNNTRDLSRAALDGKGPTRLAFLLKSSAALLGEWIR